MSVIERGQFKEYHPGVKPLATFWRQASEGTNYWRCQIPAKHLPGRINALYDIDLRQDPLARQDGVAIWQFLGDYLKTKFAASIQSAGIRCLMEIDDNYLVPPPITPGGRRAWSTTVKRSWEQGQSGYSHQAHRLILPSIDGLIVSTDELANQYEGLVPAGITVCPNSVDPDDWEPIERVDRNVVVGYAGSDSHFYDLALIERAMDYASRQGATLVKLGANLNTWRWPHEQMPWTDDLAEYRKNLQTLDIGLCPVKRSPWHDCKSDIKAMEYLMAGVLPIVQADSPCYSDWVDLVPSASTPKQWERAVKEVLSWSVDMRHGVWMEAYRWLNQNKTIDKHIHKWHSAL
jgi:hypothetical protein